MKFKTNARCGGCKSTILRKVNEKFPDIEWDLDLENADKVLEAHGVSDNPELAAQVEKAIQETGFKGSWIQAE